MLEVEAWVEATRQPTLTAPEPPRAQDLSSDPQGPRTARRPFLLLERNGSDVPWCSKRRGRFVSSLVCRPSHPPWGLARVPSVPHGARDPGGPVGRLASLTGVRL